MSAHKIVLCLPAGRRRFMEVLVRYLLRERATFDHCMLWLNNWESDDDEAYVRSLADAHPSVFKLLVRDTPVEKHPNRKFVQYQDFYQYCTAKDTIYIKLDDDIVWMSPGALGELAEFCAANPQYLAVIGNTLNNTTCNYLRGLPWGYANNPHDRIGHHCGKTAEKLHRLFLDSDWQDFVLDNYIPPKGEHSPNHVYAWRSSEFPEGMRIGDDENWLTVECTKERDKPVCYLGSVLFSHFSYTPQHEHMNSTDLLAMYKERAP